MKSDLNRQVRIFVHCVGFYTIPICFRHALKLMAPINSLDLSYHTRVYVWENSWKEVSFNSTLCEPEWLMDSYGDIFLDPRYLSDSRVWLVVHGNLPVMRMASEHLVEYSGKERKY
jgi:hypothetical protein